MVCDTGITSLRLDFTQFHEFPGALLLALPVLLGVTVLDEPVCTGFHDLAAEFIRLRHFRITVLEKLGGCFVSPIQFVVGDVLSVVCKCAGSRVVRLPEGWAVRVLNLVG